MPHAKRLLIVGLLLVTACTANPGTLSYPTPTPSPLPIPTATLSPSPTPSPNYTNLQIRANAVIGDNSLTGQTEILVPARDKANLKELSNSADGQLMSLVYTVRDADNHGHTELDLVETSSHLVTLINTGPLVSQAISPDGSWLIYIPLDPAAAQIVGLQHAPQILAKPFIHLGGGGGPRIGEVIGVPTANVSQAREIAYCGAPPSQEVVELRVNSTCEGRFVWEPNSHSVLWSDMYGLWSWQPGKPNEVQKVFTNKVTDPPAVIYYSPIDWSPLGRYVQVSVGIWGGTNKSILDIETGALSVIAHSQEGEYGGANAKNKWLADGRLRITFHGYLVGDWHIDPNQTNPLIQDTTLDSVPNVPEPPPPPESALYIENNALLQKNPPAGKNKVVVASRGSSRTLQSFAVSADLNQIALSYWNAAQTEFEIDWLNRLSGQTTVVYQGPILTKDNNKFGALALAIAPNGQSLAYAIPDQNQAQAPNQRLQQINYQVGGGGGGCSAKGQLFVTRFAESPTAIGIFNGPCTQNRPSFINWAPNSSDLAWQDDDWSYSALSGQTPEEITNGDSKLIWSPQGRYLIVQAVVDNQLRLFDAQTGQYLSLPDGIDDYVSLSVWPPVPPLSWLPDGRLLILQYPTITETWKIDPTNKDLLVQEPSS